MSHRALLVLALPLALLCHPGRASAGLFGRSEPMRPEVATKVQHAKLALVSGKRDLAQRLSYRIATTNKAERKAVEELHIDLLHSHVEESNAHLAAGNIEATAKALLAAKRHVHDAHTTNRSELSFSYPAAHKDYALIRQKMAEIESREATSAAQH